MSGPIRTDGLPVMALHPATVQRARLVVCDRATDADEAHYLLQLLGLIEEGDG